MIKINLFVLLIGLCCCALAQAQRPGRPEGPQGSRGPQAATIGSGIQSGGRGQDEEYERLCKSGDLDCLGNLFTDNSQCTPVTHEDGVPIFLEQLVTYIPRFNLSIICKNLYLTYRGAKVLSVDLEKVTNTLLIAIEFVVNLEAPDTDWYFERIGKLDKIVNEFVTITYSVIATAKIPWSRQVTLNGVEVTPFVTNPYPPFVIGPKISDSSDALFRRTYDGMLSDIPTCVVELLRTNTYYFFFTYLQNYICDFGYEYNGLIWS